jgi:exodeoxyribonuclease VII small subunit
MSEQSITFEDGYRRLQTIAERLGADEVPVHEMCDLFAEGKGLEQALGRYLAEQKARVEAIERGEGVQPFRVTAPARAPEGELFGAADDVKRPNDEIPF